MNFDPALSVANLLLTGEVQFKIIKPKVTNPFRRSLQNRFKFNRQDRWKPLPLPLSGAGRSYDISDSRQTAARPFAPNIQKYSTPGCTSPSNL